MYDCMASAEKAWGMPSPSSLPPPPAHKKRQKRLIRLRVFNVGKRRYVCIERWQMNFCPLFFLERKSFDFFPVGILKEPFVPLYVSNKRWRDYHFSYRIEYESPLQSEPLTMGRRRRHKKVGPPSEPCHQNFLPPPPPSGHCFPPYIGLADSDFPDLLAPFRVREFSFFLSLSFRRLREENY